MSTATLRINPLRRKAGPSWLLTSPPPQSLLWREMPSPRRRTMPDGQGTTAEKAATGDSRRNWSCVIDEDGRIHEYEDRAGVAQVQAMPQLVSYARAFLQTGRERVVFIWAPSTASEWFSVTFRREPTKPQSSHAIVELQLSAPAFDLTLRELDILTLVAAGLANENVAARLEISVRTVAKHLENIFRKTGIWSRAGLAGLAADQGLMRLPVPGGSDGYPLAIGQIERLAMQPASAETAPRPRPAQMRPLLIGIPHATGGRGLSDAHEMLNGAELAVAEINARGGLMGRKVEIVRAPFSAADPDSIFAAYRFLTECEVDAVSAGYACYNARAHDLVGDYGAPLLHAATMQCAVDRVRDSRARLGNIFQTCASDVNYGLGLSRFVTQLQSGSVWQPHARRIAIVQPPWPGLDIGLDAIDRTLGRLGWQIDLITVDGSSAAAWEENIRRLHGLDPSLIVVASYFVEDAVAFQRAFMNNPLRALVYGIYSPSVPQFGQELGEKADGVIWATTTGLYSDAIGNGFRRRYLQRFGAMPGLSQAGIAYDRVNMLAGAWSRVGSARRFADVMEDLRSSISRGVNGAYYLGSEGQVGLAFPDDTADPSISQAHLVFQVQEGESVIIEPSPYAHGRLRLPPWMTG